MSFDQDENLVKFKLGAPFVCSLCGKEHGREAQCFKIFSNFFPSLKIELRFGANSYLSDLMNCFSYLQDRTKKSFFITEENLATKNFEEAVLGKIISQLKELAREILELKPEDLVIHKDVEWEELKQKLKFGLNIDKYGSAVKNLVKVEDEFIIYSKYINSNSRRKTKTLGYFKRMIDGTEKNCTKEWKLYLKLRKQGVIKDGEKVD